MNNITAIYNNGLWETRDDIESGLSMLHKSPNAAILLHYKEIQQEYSPLGKVQIDQIKGYAYLVIQKRG